MNYAKIAYEFKGEIEIAPIHVHYILEDLTAILKDLSKLEGHGIKTDGIMMKLNVEYIPVSNDDRITQVEK